MATAYYVKFVNRWVRLSIVCFILQMSPSYLCWTTFCLYFKNLVNRSLTNMLHSSLIRYSNYFKNLQNGSFFDIFNVPQIWVLFCWFYLTFLKTKKEVVFYSFLECMKLARGLFLNIVRLIPDNLEINLSTS